MKISLLLLSCWLFLVPWAWAQESAGEAGEDKVVCKGSSVQIGTPPHPDYCYFWEAANGLTDAHISNPSVNPTETTTYKLTITGRDFSFQRTDEVIVYVPTVILDGPYTDQKYEFDASSDGKLNIKFQASVDPAIDLVVNFFKDKIKFSVDPIGKSKLEWSNQDGIALWDGSSFTVEAKFTGLPNSNADFGIKKFKMAVQDCGEADKEDQIKIYFEKDARNNPGGSLPNWFYYWSSFLPRMKITTLIYNNSIGGYGQTLPRLRQTTVTQLASEENDETKHKGIHTYYETLVHENHHITLWDQWWGERGSRIPSKDTDNDLYPDEWEANDPEAIAYGFAVGVNDHYNLGGPTGYKFEEDKCRALERSLNSSEYDTSDWSYDPSNKFQGKQH